MKTTADPAKPGSRTFKIDLHILTERLECDHFQHLANASVRPVIEAVCKAKGHTAPIICTPEELLESKP